MQFYSHCHHLHYILRFAIRPVPDIQPPRLFCPVLDTALGYIYIVCAAVTLDCYRAGVCYMRKRKHEKIDRNIVDRKPEKMNGFDQCIFTLLSPTNLAPSGCTRAHEVPASIA